MVEGGRPFPHPSGSRAVVGGGGWEGERRCKWSVVWNEAVGLAAHGCMVRT